MTRGPAGRPSAIRQQLARDSSTRPLGLGTTRPVAGLALSPPGRRAVLHPARSHAGSAVGPGVRSHPTASRCLSRQGTAAVRAAPATPRACRGDVARGRPTGGHPASTRTRRPCDHVGLPTRHRQHRDCPRRARATSSDDSGAERPQPVGLRRPGGSRAARPTTFRPAGTAPSRWTTPASPKRKQARRTPET
jgi:hypothetical protein